MPNFLLTRMQKPVRFFMVVEPNYGPQTPRICLCDELGRPVKQGMPGVEGGIFDDALFARADLRMKITSSVHEKQLLLNQNERTFLDDRVQEGAAQQHQARRRLRELGTV